MRILFGFAFLGVAWLVSGQTPSYLITTAAGGATPYYYPGTGDGGPATSAALGKYAFDVTVDSAKNLYIVAGPLIRKVAPSGNITTVAGGGLSVGDYVQATQAQLSPLAIVSDPAGNLYIADTAFGNSRIRKVDTKGIITTFAGGAPCCALGDGGPATAAYLSIPYGLALDSAGNLYIAQAGQFNVIRKISSDGSINTIAGGGTLTGDGRATSVSLTRPCGVTVDAQGNVYIADAGANRIRKVSAAGAMSTIAGSGATGNTGDGGSALQAGIDSPWHLAADSSGNVYVTQIADARVRFVSVGGTITTLAGNGTNGSSGDTGPAAAATVENPAGIVIGAASQIYFTQAGETAGRVRLLTPGGSGTPSGCTGVYTISGQVMFNGNALYGVAMTLSGGAGSATQTDGSGSYTFSNVPCGGNYTITPSLSGYAFAPPSISYTALAANQTGANFAASKSATNVTLSVSPVALNFSYQVSTTPSAQTIAVSSSNNGTPFVVSAQTNTPPGVNWLAASPNSGTAPATLIVSLVNTSGLVPGTYTGSITVSFPDGSGAQIVNVTLAVGAAFDVQTPSLQFTISNGNAPTQSVLVTNLSPQDLTITGSSQSGYLAITPPQVTVKAASGNRQSQFLISAVPSALPGGLLSYADSLVLSAAGQALKYPVSISLSNQSGQPLLSSTAATLVTVAGTNSYDQVELQLLNAGTSSLDFYISLPDDWIDVSPAAPVCTMPPCTNVLLGPQQIQPLTISTNDNVKQAALQPANPKTNQIFTTSATVRYGSAAELITVYLDVLPTGSTIPPRSNYAGVLVGLPNQTRLQLHSPTTTRMLRLSISRPPSGCPLPAEKSRAARHRAFQPRT